MGLPLKPPNTKVNTLTKGHPHFAQLRGVGPDSSRTPSRGLRLLSGCLAQLAQADHPHAARPRPVLAWAWRTCLRRFRSLWQKLARRKTRKEKTRGTHLILKKMALRFEPGPKMMASETKDAKPVKVTGYRGAKGPSKARHVNSSLHLKPGNCVPVNNQSEQGMDAESNKQKQESLKLQAFPPSTRISTRNLCNPFWSRLVSPSPASSRNLLPESNGCARKASVSMHSERREADAALYMHPVLVPICFSAPTSEPKWL